MNISSKLKAKVEEHEGVQLFKLEATGPKGDKPFKINDKGDLELYITKDTALRLAWNVFKKLGEPSDSGNH